jgi:hypothetical protein
MVAGIVIGVAGEGYFLWTLLAEDFLTWGVYIIGPILCLIAITAFNLYWMRVLYQIVRPARPERLVFAGDVLEYDPGFAHVRDARPSWVRRWNSMEIRTRPKRTTKRSDVRAVLLKHAANRQKLTLKTAAADLEIGVTLTEPEREWLADVIRAWAQSRSN